MAEETKTTRVTRISLAADSTENWNALNENIDGGFIPNTGEPIVYLDEDEVPSIKIGYGGKNLSQLSAIGGLKVSENGSLAQKNAEALGENSVAFGNGVSAAGTEQAAFGRFNIPIEGEDALIVVGNGTSDTERSNAFVIYKDGSASIGAPTSGESAINAQVLHSYLNFNANDTYVKGYSVSTSPDGTASIANGKNASGAVTIPGVYSGYLIRNISKECFIKNLNISEVDIQEGIQKIFYTAFQNCTNLKKVHFPNTLAYIDYNAFQNTALENIVLPESLQCINRNAFRSVPLKCVIKIPKNCRYIGYDIGGGGNDESGYVFTNTVNSVIPAIVFEGTPIKISNNAFKNCTCDIYVPWSEGEVAKPESSWGSTGKVHYNYQYATKDWVEDQGYAKQSEIPSLDGYAKTSDIPDVSGFISEIPSEYITESELNAKGYAKVADLNAYAKSSDIPTNVSAFTNDANYATKDYVDDATERVESDVEIVQETGTSETAVMSQAAATRSFVNIGEDNSVAIGSSTAGGKGYKVTGILHSDGIVTKNEKYVTEDSYLEADREYRIKWINLPEDFEIPKTFVITFNGTADEIQYSDTTTNQVITSVSVEKDSIFCIPSSDKWEYIDTDFTPDFIESVDSYDIGINGLTKNNYLLYQTSSSDIYGYELQTTDGLEPGMNYSIRLSSARYSCGEITEVYQDRIIVSGAPQDIKTFNPNPDDPETGFVANVLTITGHPELGDVNVGIGAFTAGVNTYAQEYGAASFGYGNNSLGKYSFTAGNGNIAGYAGVAFNSNNKALGDQSAAFGNNNTITGGSSLAEGNGNEVTGNRSHAGGESNKQHAYASNVTGSGNTVQSTATYAEVSGEGNTVSGRRAFVHGYNSEVTHENAAVFGAMTKSSRVNQLVAGKLNDPESATDALFVIGNGETTRKNAFVIHDDGRATVQTAGTGANDVVIKSQLDNYVKVQSASGGGTYSYIRNSNGNTDLKRMTSAADANTIVLRDGNGNFKAALPNDAADVVNKQYVDNAIASIDIPETDLSNYYTKAETKALIPEVPTQDKHAVTLGYAKANFAPLKTEYKLITWSTDVQGTTYNLEKDVKYLLVIDVDDVSDGELIYDEYADGVKSVVNWGADFFTYESYKNNFDEDEYYDGIVLKPKFISEQVVFIIEHPPCYVGMDYVVVKQR